MCVKLRLYNEISDSEVVITLAFEASIPGSNPGRRIDEVKFFLKNVNKIVFALENYIRSSFGLLFKFR